MPSIAVVCWPARHCGAVPLVDPVGGNSGCAQQLSSQSLCKEKGELQTAGFEDLSKDLYTHSTKYLSVHQLGGERRI